MHDQICTQLVLPLKISELYRVFKREVRVGLSSVSYKFEILG
jgi:hypothetical protein